MVDPRFIPGYQAVENAESQGIPLFQGLLSTIQWILTHLRNREVVDVVKWSIVRVATVDFQLHAVAFILKSW